MLDRLWAAWRGEYVAGADAANAEGCVFCALLASDLADSETHIVWRGSQCFAVLNAFPYTSGHLLVMPQRHVSELEALTLEETAELWAAVTTAVVAIKAAYGPDGVNLGANVGRAAGAGIPAHFHVHALPRWTGDTNFMTSVAEARVMPEALSTSWDKLTAAWPGA
jgi:diadenosine tetraphosphate (Ap4A) HIT family hydrolase